jgi:hypothetical protein
MNVQRLVEEMRSERERWEALLARIGTERMEEPGVDGDWSVKDVVAHVTAYERRILKRLRAHARGEQYTPAPHDRLEDIDERNAIYHEQDKGRNLDEVLADHRATFDELVRLTAELDDQDLREPTRLGWPADVDFEPWESISGNSYGHYEEHVPNLEAWLASRGA